MATMLDDRILSAQLLDDTLSDNMVWKAGKRLCADDIIDSAVNQLKHLSGQEPALAGLIAARIRYRKPFWQVRQYGTAESKCSAFSKCFGGGAAQPFQKGDAEVCDRSGAFF